MMLTRFALLAVVVVALTSLTEALTYSAKKGKGGGRGRKNACGEALRPDFTKLREYFEACKDSPDHLAFKKCMAQQQGWVTAAGAFDEAAFRTYIAGKISTASADVQTHVNSRLDGCLTAANMAAFKIWRIMNCLMKGCPAA